VIHGDLHLGQILLTGSLGDGELVFVDFEGEVLSTSSVGVDREPIERDLGALQRSFAYVEALRPQSDHRRALPDADLFAIFLEAYRSRLGSDSVSDALVRVYALEKAAYELEYEIVARRGLVAIPMAYLMQT
jgi:predicted trehalose synthase